MINNLYTKVNKLFKLHFEKDATEIRFQSEYLYDNINQNKFALIFSIAIYMLYIPISYVITPNDFVINFIIILTLPVSTLSVLLWLIYKQLFKKHLTINLLIIATFIIGLVPILSLVLTQQYHQIYFSNFMISLVIISILFGVPFFVSLISLLTLMFILSLVIIVSPGFEAIDITHNIYIIFTTFIVSIISSYLIEKNQRESYLSKYIQEDLNDTFIEETLKNMKKDKLLKQQSRLAQMGEMISMIAHQWRQPLAAISSTSNNITLKIAMGELDNDELLQEVMLISDYAQHLSKTIDDFRGFMKDDKIKVKTRFKHLVNSTLNIAKTSLENKHIEVVTSFNIEDDVPSFMTYQSELKQVILNLLKNAEDILLEKKIQNPTIRIETYFKNDTYILKVKDNAGGIPEDIMDKIFDPYFSTKLEKDGTGLGLYMSKTIVEEHCGGKLKASNDKDGAVFTVELYS